MMQNKKQMSEEDIKRNYITPAIEAKWDKSKITMETPITDGKIITRGNCTSREKRKITDYLLYLYPNYPIAVVEAKDNNKGVSHGLQQAMEYALMLHLPFAYSSNGDGFIEHDFLTGKEKELSLDEFPTEDELIKRYKASLNNGKGFTEDQEKILNQPYFTSQNSKPPRYYQRIAINKTLDVIARGQNRILLVMATGTGKTYTAFQIVYRLLKSEIKKKILYLADRNILIDQSIQQDFSPLEKVIHKINFAKDDKTTITSYQVYFSLYQQLTSSKQNNNEESEDETLQRFAKLFSPDFFDLIIVDECHRGSAKEDSRWRKILEYFKSATQIGMTATPKETNYTSNIDYFAEPVYTYSLNNGIEDGFLAPFKVIKYTTNISEGWRPIKGQKDYYGELIEDRIYSNSDYDYNIVIKDRTYEVASAITEYLKRTNDRFAKTIVFCPTEDAALRMRDELVNLNSDLVKDYPDYIVRITGGDEYGKSKLDYFISVSSPCPVIATTSQLLSTGVDCKATKLIVLDKMIGSMTEFKQIIGRGTRIREDVNKDHFVVMDFRNVTHLFADPDWDGPIEQSPGFGGPNGTPIGGGGDGEGEPLGGGEAPNGGPIGGPISEPKPRKIYVVDKDGCKVEIISKVVAIYDSKGKLLRQESIVDYTKENIRGKFASLDNFILEWRKDSKKDRIKEMLRERGIDLEMLKKDEHFEDVDDFDFICHIAFNQKPLTRKERVKNVKKRNFLNKYNGVAREILEALLEKYMNLGIYEIEKAEVLTLDPFKKYGNPVKISKYFGGKEGYLKAIKELEDEIYLYA